MSKRKNKKVGTPVNVDVVLIQTSNGFHINAGDINGTMLKRILAVAGGRVLHVDGAWKGLVGRADVVLWNPTDGDTHGYFSVERCEKRVLKYPAEEHLIVSSELFKWMIRNEKLPRTITFLYNNDLVHPRNTVGGASGFHMSLPIYEQYKRVKIISDANGNKKKEIWRLK